MDDQTYFARRPALAASFGMAEDADARFRALVQSPLRAGLLRYLNARPNEAFDVDGLMQAFGRLRLDVENCVHELVDCGVAVEVTAPDGPTRFTAARPADDRLAAALDIFLERRAIVSTEDRLLAHTPAWLRRLAGPDLLFDVQLGLQQHQMPEPRLGRPGTRLGQTTWIGRRPATDRHDLRLRPGSSFLMRRQGATHV